MQLFFALRIQQATDWIRTLPAGIVHDKGGEAITGQKWTSCGICGAEVTWRVRADASSFGVGAILHKCGRPLAWVAEEWSEDDSALLKAQCGDPAWQAEWELLAALTMVDP